MNGSIFSGLKILDFGAAATVPLALAWIADYGAEVIKVETHLRPDISRAGGPFYEARMGEIDHAGWQEWLNPSKYSITLNLGKPAGKEIVRRLITQWQPDILAESFRPGVMKRFGLDYGEVKNLKPDIIYWSSCLEGQYGPHCQRLGYGPVSTNLSGVSYLSGWPDRPPCGAPMAYGDFASTGTGIIALISALIRRRKTGRGVHIDQSQYEVNVHVLAGVMMEYMINGRIMKRNGNGHPSAAPHGVYPCSGEDRWVAIAVLSEADWNGFCRVLGQPDWTRSEKFNTLAGRKAHEDELDRLVGLWTVSKTAEEIEALMQESGVAANVVETGKDIYEDRQLAHYGHFRRIDHPIMGTINSEWPPFKFSKTTDTHKRAPLLGEHNHFVLSDILEMSEDEISDLYAEGVITTDADLPGAS